MARPLRKLKICRMSNHHALITQGGPRFNVGEWQTLTDTIKRAFDTSWSEAERGSARTHIVEMVREPTLVEWKLALGQLETALEVVGILVAIVDGVAEELQGSTEERVEVAATRALEAAATMTEAAKELVEAVKELRR